MRLNIGSIPTEAVKADMESASSTGVFVTPAVAKYHPGVSKAWINFDGTSGSIGTGRASYNMDSVTDNGVGDWTVNYTTDFSSTNYCVTFGVRSLAVNCKMDPSNAPTAGATRIIAFNSVFQLTDSDYICVAVHGDQ